MDHEFVLEDRLAQAGLQRQLFHRGHLHAGTVELEIIAAAAFRLMHRHFRLVDHRLGFLARVGEHADADAGAQQQFMAVDQERLFHHVDQLLAEHADLRLGAAVFQHQGEFVAAHPGQVFIVDAAPADALRGQLQQAVADFMAEAFVDRFEAVQVDHQQRRFFPVQPRQGQRPLQAFAEQRPVGQAGEAVVVGEKLHPLLGFLARGKIGQHPHIADHPLFLVQHAADLQPFREGLAVAAPFVDLAFPEPGAAQRQGDRAVSAAVAVDVVGVGDGAAEHVLLRVAGDLLEAGVHRQELEVAVQNEDAFRGVLEHRRRQPLLFLGFAGGGDVPAGADHAQGAALVVPVHHPAFVLDPAPGALGVAQPVDGVVAVGLALEVGDHGAADGGEIVRVDQLLQVAEEVSEILAFVAQQPVEVGVVIGAGDQIPVPQPDVAGVQRQLQALAGGA